MALKDSQKSKISNIHKKVFMLGNWLACQSMQLLILEFGPTMQVEITKRNN